MAADPKTEKAIAALDTMAAIWAVKTNARQAVRAMLACSDAEDRLMAYLQHGHAEGLFEGFHAGKDFRRPDGAELPAGIFDATGERVQALAKDAGFNLGPTPNMLYTVRGNHAQLVNFARLVIATYGDAASPATPALQQPESEALQERYDFVLAACRDAQDMASRYGYALHDIAHGEGDPIVTARNALLGSSALQRQEVPIEPVARNALLAAWRAPEPAYFEFDKKKPKPDGFAAYTVLQLHKAFADGVEAAAGVPARDKDERPVDGGRSTSLRGESSRSCSPNGMAAPNTNKTDAVAPSGLDQQLASATEASDEGHDPLCMAILRGKACTCGHEERNAGVEGRKP